MAERTVAIVTSHFPPSNLAGVHRARLLSQHLQEFGWRPLIVTTHWKYYEEPLDWDLASLTAPSLDVIRTGAIPTKPVRLLGDVGIRAFAWHLATLRRLRQAKRFDFLHITIPSFYSAMLGECLYLEHALPFGIDFQDPWVHSWPPAEIRYSKAWVSMKLAERLEPYAVRHASLITGVAASYYRGVFERNPALNETCQSAAMPIGFSNVDFAAPGLATRVPSCFDPSDGNLHLVYAGALLPKAGRVLDRMLEGLKLLRDRGSPVGQKIRIHFIGTGSSPNDINGYQVLPAALKWGLGGVVSEHPHRMSYLDVLVHLKRAQGILILGSNERHYTPSKVFQAIQSRRPVLALLHEASTATGVLESSRAGVAIRLGDHRLPEAATVADALEHFVASPYDAAAIDWAQFEAFSARESARQMAAAFDAAMLSWDKKKRA